MGYQSRFFPASVICITVLLATFVPGASGADTVNTQIVRASTDIIGPLKARPPKIDQRISSLEAQVNKNPTNADLQNKYGEALMQKGRENNDLDCYNRAQEAFKTAAKLDTESSVSLRNLAWAYTIHHRFQEAIEYANQAISRNDKDNQAYGVLADSYMELGDYDKALVAAQKMIDIRPDLSSYSRGAQLRWWFGDARGAMRLMQKAADSGGSYDENAAWCRVQLGDMYFKTGNIPAAEQQFNQALTQKPGFKHALVGLSRVRAAQNKLPEAADLLKKATDGAAQIAYVIEYGDLLTKMGKTDDAAKQFARVDPLVQEHLKNGIQGDEMVLAMFYLDHGGDLKKAFELADGEVKEGHQSVQAYTTQAWAFYKSERYPEAEKAIESALRTKTQDPLLMYRAGKIYQAAGNTQKARSYLAKAIDLNPHFSVPFADDAFTSLRSISVAQRK